MAFADATSAGQEVCAVPTVAERETADTTLNTVARTFFISAILSLFGFELRYPLLHLPASGPEGPELAAYDAAGMP
jgi:hypothetical protein